MEHHVLITREVGRERETLAFAREAVLFFKTGNTVLLYGEMGSGKTFLVREFVQLLDSKQQASSPSFTILNQYSGRFKINHIDLYRISHFRELANLGLEDFWEGDFINFIEWPEIIENRITWPHFRIYIEVHPTKKLWRKFRLSQYNG